MTGEERRDALLAALQESDAPVSGGKLASLLHVSRQIIVQDVALLRASGKVIIPTSHGYILQGQQQPSRVFKVIHTEAEAAEELTIIVDNGGRVEDEFVFHKIYGVVRCGLKIRSRRDIENFLGEMEGSKSKMLLNTTSGYHYHTVSADSRATLDLIQEKLQARGFLAPLQEYEPVNFWAENT